MDAAPVLAALATGALFGLSAGLSPGPLLALVITQTLRHGPVEGARIAMAPLLTDVPIVAACTLLVGVLAGSDVALGVIALVGALVVAWLAWDTWRARPPGAPATQAAPVTQAAPAEDAAPATQAAPVTQAAPAEDTGGTPRTPGTPTPRSWTRGAVVNALSPHPWLFWIAVGSPTMLAAFAVGGLPAAVAFLAGFYTCLVGSKVVVAAATGRARGRISGRGYTRVTRALALLLAVFAVGLVNEGIGLLLGA